jgi:uroporphyrinogen III methyltransferase/synthase
MKGKVVLVGAGPGDPGLLTRKGEAILRRAEVLIYDRLVDDSLLRLVPEDCEKIYVGKQAGHHVLPQWQINQLLLEHAQRGQYVVRLKGGDPFLFGRGGEELALLAQYGIPYEVVPGVTSALAAPAYQGIQVTHRDCASSLHIVTGHPQAGKAADIPFDALVAAGGTLVFLMGVASLERICQGLLAAGMAADTPAAVVENGTLPQQRSVTATLATLHRQVEQAGLHSPAVIVVGEVARETRQRPWFTALPLHGKRVVVTRPEERSMPFASALRQRGAEVLEVPTIQIAPMEELTPLREALCCLAEYEWVAFTSAEGVRVVWDTLWQMGLDSRALAGRRIAAVGPATAEALRQRGLRADYVPEVYDTAHLAQGLARRATGPVLLPRADLASPQLREVLEQAGIPCREVAVYRIRCLTEPEPRLADWCRAGGAYVTFTSPSTVRGFVARLPKEADPAALTALCIGEPTARAAAQAGFVPQKAEEATMAGLLALVERVCAQPPEEA